MSTDYTFVERARASGDPPEKWRPGRLTIRSIPGGSALVDSSWPGDGEICRVLWGDRTSIPIAKRWFFISTIAEAWARMAEGDESL